MAILKKINSHENCSVGAYAMFKAFTGPQSPKKVLLWPT